MNPPRNSVSEIGCIVLPSRIETRFVQCCRCLSSDIENDTSPRRVCPFLGWEKSKLKPASAPVCCVNFVSLLPSTRDPVEDVLPPSELRWTPPESTSAV